MILKDGIPTGEYEDFMTGFVIDDRHVWGGARWGSPLRKMARSSSLMTPAARSGGSVIAEPAPGNCQFLDSRRRQAANSLWWRQWVKSKEWRYRRAKLTSGRLTKFQRVLAFFARHPFDDKRLFPPFTDEFIGTLLYLFGRL